MRIPFVCVVSAALLLASGCSRDKTPAATAPSTAPATTATATPPAAAPAARPKEVLFSAQELHQLVAPIALYPDPLLAQVLMASTYPGDVAEAALWSKAHPDAKGDEAVKLVASEPWDPSVQSLVAFPQVLYALGNEAAWVQRMGDAFLAQPDDVMNAVQHLRHKAKAKGNLESNQYQRVSSQPRAARAAQSAQAAPASSGQAAGGYESLPETDSIVIESSDPSTVYVPSYDPNTAYGEWDYPDYPPTYYPPPPNYYPMGGALATGLMFGVGLAAADALWGDVDWDDDDIDIDVDRYNNINTNRQINATQNNWNHNPANRDGVPYRDQYNRQNNSQRLAGADARSEYRGEDAQRARSREQARESMQKRGVDAPARSNQEARDRAKAAAGDRGQAAGRDRAQADRARSAGRDQTRERAQRPSQAAREGARSRSQSPTRHRQTQSNTQARTTARSQREARQSPRNNAFDGASRPQQSRASARRGQSSHASAQRSGSSRSSGQQRQSAQRQSGSHQRQASGRR